jgi:hypothetical protein
VAPRPAGAKYLRSEGLSWEEEFSSGVFHTGIDLFQRFRLRSGKTGWAVYIFWTSREVSRRVKRAFPRVIDEAIFNSVDCVTFFVHSARQQQ